MNILNFMWGWARIMFPYMLCYFVGIVFGSYGMKWHYEKLMKQKK